MSEFLKAHLESDPIPPSKGLPGIPDDLESILILGLEKEPSHRPESAQALKDSLLKCRDSGHWSNKDAASWWAENGESLIHPELPKGETLTRLIENGTDVTLTIQDMKDS